MQKEPHTSPATPCALASSRLVHIKTNRNKARIRLEGIKSFYEVLSVQPLELYCSGSRFLWPNSFVNGNTCR
jgi:hypothetical protein